MGQDMQAIQELYKNGRGPSSSHTLAPERACKRFTDTFGPFPYYRVELYGSLSLTGHGHSTDKVIEETLPGEVEVVFKLNWEESFPNGFYLFAYDENHVLQHKWTVFSIGGGSIQIVEAPDNDNAEVYNENSFAEIKEYLMKHEISILDYIYSYEPNLPEYLNHILDAMCDCVERGLSDEGELPGKLRMTRCAKDLYRTTMQAKPYENQNLRLMSYAYAASEENAAGHQCVTAPTLGSCGVLAALMYFCKQDLRIRREKLIDALAVGGLFGNLIKTNATISGAVGGCQAEVGAAVSMAAAAFCWIHTADINKVEYAAEIGMEHNLGLTCDPIMGYVMIPCIERNAMGVLRSVEAAQLAQHLGGIRKHLVSFDMVVDTMRETGMKLPIELKETAEGGLAKEYLDAKYY